MATHVAILLRPYLQMMLDGRKTIESRFTLRPLPPYRRISAGDTIFFKASAGPYMAKAKAKRVEFLDRLTVGRMREIYRRYNRSICGTPDFWTSKKYSRYGTLIWLSSIEATVHGPELAPSRGLAWFVLNGSTNPSGSHRPPRESSRQHGQLDFEAVLTAGALRNRYVGLPAGIAAGLRGRELTMHLPDGVQISTSVTASRFRWRGWGRYFHAHGAHAGSRVRFSRTGRSIWRVTFHA